MVTTNTRKVMLIFMPLGVIITSLITVVIAGGIGFPPHRDLRDLGKAFIANSYNIWNKTLTSYSLNVVSAIIWDYRGVDTLLETAVLFAAVTGLAAIFRNVKEMFLGEYRGLSTIVKISAKLIVILTAIASISIVVCGHLTPGGGFQGGSTLAAITTLIIVAYSIEAMYRKKITLGKILKLRYSAFAILLLVAITPVAYGLFSQVKTYYLQNSVKEDSWFSMPTSFFGTPLGGSIFFFNLVEYIVVASSIAFIVMLLSMRLRELGLED